MLVSSESLATKPRLWILNNDCSSRSSTKRSKMLASLLTRSVAHRHPSTVDGEPFAGFFKKLISSDKLFHSSFTNDYNSMTTKDLVHYPKYTV